MFKGVSKRFVAVAVAFAAGVTVGGVSLANAASSPATSPPATSPYSTVSGSQPVAVQQQTTQQFGSLTLQPFGSPPDARNVATGAPAPHPTSSISQQQAVQAAGGVVGSTSVQPSAVLAEVTVSDYGTPPVGFPTPGVGTGSEPNLGSNANGFVPFYDQKPLWVVEYQGLAGQSHGGAPIPGEAPASGVTVSPSNTTTFIFIDPTSGKYLFGESG
jgi:hypothetical protein